jgi:hypothetical protein
MRGPADLAAWEEAIHAAIMADEYEAVLALPRLQDRTNLRTLFEAAREFSKAARARMRRRHLAALVCMPSESPGDLEAPAVPFAADARGQSDPLETPPPKECYNTVDVAQEGQGTLESDSAGRVQEARSGDCAHSEGRDRKGEGGVQAPEAQVRQKAVEFLRFYLTTDSRFEIGRGEAAEALDGVLEILHGSQVHDLDLRDSFERWTQLRGPKRL